MLQNNSEKTYIIEPNKKIAQTIFLLLVKIAQLVSVKNRKELEITVKKISGFGFTITGTELAIPFISPAVQIIGDNLKINSVIGGSNTSHNRELTALHKHTRAKKRPKTSSNIWCSFTETTQQNNFKVATTPDATTLEYYQLIYTHCKQRFNIPDGIEVVKKSVYQYIENHINNYFFRNYNISEVRSNLYNNLVHYSQLETKDLNSETLVTYFQELNFNIIKYCEEIYPVQSQYSIDFESETETSNKDKQKLKQYSKTTSNTPILPKTTAKHLQTPEQGTKDFTLPRSPTRQQELLQTSSNLLDFLAENQSEHYETAANKENDSEISKEESIDSENKEDKMTAYIAKIPKFNREDIETSPQKWLNQVTKAGDANRWNAAKMLRTILYFLKGTAGEWFENLTTSFNDWTAFKTAFLEQFTDNNTSITLRNCFHNIKQEPSESVMTYIGKFKKLLRQICQLETNNYYSDAQILDQFIAGLKDKLIKKIHSHAPEDLNSAIQHAKRYKMAMKEANCTKLMNLIIGETSSAAEEKIDQLAKKVENYFTNQQQQQPQRYQPPQRRNQNNFTSPSNNQPQTCLQPIQQQYQQPPTQHYQVPARKLIPQNQFTPQNRYQFEANKSPFLLSNVATNKQKAITAIYTKAKVEEKAIHLILNSGSAGSIITYQLMQQLKRNVDRQAQTVIITADSMKKTPVKEIDNFLFTLNGITIPVKVLVMDVPQYQALVPVICGTFNKCSKKALAFEFKPEEEKPIIETFMALGSTSNWADETKQQYFSTNDSLETKEPVTTGWNVPYSKPKPQKQCPYIPLKCKDCQRNSSQWKPAFHLKKNMKIILVITARLATENNGAI
ncbi:hypothetical protein G9A89_005134 [Geosiphon pyriformis]|nr:hypothetical protein G9A89_005134 [Geosiphon pyriformis]